MALTSKLKAIADAIRLKKGTSNKMTLEQMATEIASIETGSSDVPFAFGGLNAVKVCEYSETWNLADTSFVIGSTSSTSATTIKASTANRFTNTTGSPTYAYGDKDIVVIQRCLALPTHVGSTKKVEHIASASCYVTYFTKRPTSDVSGNTTRQPCNASVTMTKYYNSSGTITRGNASYGFYMTPTTPTVASGTASSTYMRCGSPTLYSRASTTYESADNMKKVTDCIFDWKLEVYVVDKDSTPNRIIQDEIDLLLRQLYLNNVPSGGGPAK